MINTLIIISVCIMLVIAGILIGMAITEYKYQKIISDLIMSLLKRNDKQKSLYDDFIF